MNKIKLFSIILIIIVFFDCKEKIERNSIIRDKALQTDYIIDTNLSLDEYANEEGYFPNEGLVPTAEIAFQIAEPILSHLFGKEHIENEKPFSVNLESDIWIIKGTLYSRKGGTAYVEIRKNNGEILKIIHEK